MKSNGHRLMSIDFETWIFSENINKEKLSINDLRELDNGHAPKALDYLLKILKKNKQKITFFVVLKLEEIYPGILEKIKNAGHEIGFHGYTHAFIYNAEILKIELEQAKKYIKKYDIIGYQAPRILHVKEGYKLLKKYGFVYSSSIYGNPNKIYKFDGILEIPVSVSNSNYAPDPETIVFPSNMTFANMVTFGIPYGSSYFWSVLRENYYRKKLKETEKNDTTVTLFMHNWQLVKQISKSNKYKPPEDSNPFLQPLYYPYTVNVSRMFESLLRDFKFQTYKDYLYEKKYLPHSR